MEPSPAPPRIPWLARRARHAVRSGWAHALLGGWLLAKQLVWSPPLQRGAPVRVGAIVASAAVALLVTGAAVRFRGRAQLLALLALDAALTGVYQIHLLYHRQFSELASVAALAFAPLAAHVGGAILALFRPGDALLWADVAALAGAAALVRRGSLPSARRGAARVLTLAGALLFVAPALPLLHRPLTGPRHLAITRAEVAATLNVTGYQLFDAATFLRRRLDRSGRGSLPEVLAYHQARAAPSGPLSGTQRGRNVIVVQLESVQAFPVGLRVNGARVTPSLDRLARESLAFTRAFAQVGQGVTSDAELLAGCSLYPLEVGAVFTERHDIDLRCLPEVLREAGYHTVAMHANWPNFWNRDRMYPAMGYERFFSIRDFDRSPVIGLGLSDARFLEQAAERLAALPEPYYAVLVTLSNHAPFVDPNLPRTLPLGALRATPVGDYLDSVRFTDAALGALVDRLRATGVLDRSVLVVYGDHHGISRDTPGTELLDLPVQRADAWLLHEARVPLLVRLPAGRHAGPRREPAGQVDIAPTIADLLGIPWERTFFQGRSLVSDPPRPVVLADGSAITEPLVLLGEQGRWGPPGCIDAATGTPVTPERCGALADHAARELAISRAAVNQDLFRWMPGSARSEDRHQHEREHVGQDGEPEPPAPTSVHGAQAMVDEPPRQLRGHGLGLYRTARQRLQEGLDGPAGSEDPCDPRSQEPRDGESGDRLREGALLEPPRRLPQALDLPGRAEVAPDRRQPGGEALGDELLEDRPLLGQDPCQRLTHRHRADQHPVQGGEADEEQRGEQERGGAICADADQPEDGACRSLPGFRGRARAPDTAGQDDQEHPVHEHQRHPAAEEVEQERAHGPYSVESCPSQLAVGHRRSPRERSRSPRAEPNRRTAGFSHARPPR
jgi:phosphoglycerol transferase MdoB-like AlkP superfamily enzyme